MIAAADMIAVTAANAAAASRCRHLGPLARGGGANRIRTASNAALLCWLKCPIAGNWGRPAPHCNSRPIAAD